MSVYDETCRCGASVHVESRSSIDIVLQVSDWRARHRCMPPERPQEPPRAAETPGSRVPEPPEPKAIVNTAPEAQDPRTADEATDGRTGETS